ncbi:MAG: HYR domain-containing protein [Saprospiraceae bacterium]|nr:HYR domain-containing protein [Saprospiraceae bacterium]
MEGPAVNLSSYTTYNNNLFPGTGNEGLYVGMWEGANFFRVKIKNDNSTQWLGLTPTPYTGKVYQSSTGDFYVINVLHLGTQVKLLKISSGGALLWQKIFNYNFPVGNSHHQNVIQTADGGVLVAFQAPPDSIAVLKLDGNGNQQWFKKIAATSYNDIGTLQIGNTYFVGTPQASPTIHKFDLNGNKTGEIQTAGYIRLIGTADGNLLLGSVDNTAGQDLSLKKFSPTGSLIWSKVYEKDDLGVYPRALRMMPDGGFLYVGDGASNQSLVLVVRTDADGNVAGGPGCSPDVTPPVIAGCPANISVNSATPASVSWTSPTATDNCGTPTLTSTHQPGATFSFGTTTVTYTSTDAANNTANCAFTVTVNQIVQTLPDLTLTNLSAPISGTAGSVVNFTFKLDNIGTATVAGNYVIGAYLSTDNTWSANDVLAGTVPTGNTPVNYNTTVPASITIPLGTTAGNYFLICVADNGNVIQESNENNNIVSAVFEVTGGGGPANYCAAHSNFPWEDWIAAVQIGSQEKTSGKSTYSDFSPTFNFNLSQGSNAVKLTGGFSYFGFEEYWRIWIDFNRDGDFVDAGELVLSTVMPKGPNGVPTQSVNTSFNIPTVTLPGVTRMRVIMKRGAFASPCENIPFGEIEDYSVNIAAQGACKKDIPGTILLPRRGSCGWAVLPLFRQPRHTNPLHREQGRRDFGTNFDSSHIGGQHFSSK